MSTALGLAMQISANTAQLAQAVQDVNARLDEMGQAGKKAASDLGSLKNIEIAKLALGGIKAATNAFIALSGAVTDAVSSVASFAISVGKELDALNDVANRTGVGVEALQAYARAAAATGVEIESFASQIQKLTVNIGKATLDEKAQKKFEALGIVFADLKQQTPEQQFETIVDALSRIADPAERAAKAVQLFGKGGIQLGELFTLGPGALAQMREEAVALGQVVSEDAVKAIDNMNDSFGAVYATVKGLAGTILGELAGPISEIAQDLLNVVKEAGPQKIAQQFASGLLSFIKVAGNAFFELAKFIEAFVKKFAPILGLELRSPEQQARDKEIARLRQQTAVPAGVFDNKLRQAIDEENAPRFRRLRELEAQNAQESAGGTLSQLQANFNSAVDTATSSLERRLNGTQKDVVVSSEDQVNEQKKTNALLQQGLATPVDITGG